MSRTVCLYRVTKEGQGSSVVHQAAAWKAERWQEAQHAWLIMLLTSLTLRLRCAGAVGR